MPALQLARKTPLIQTDQPKPADLSGVAHHIFEALRAFLAPEELGPGGDDVLQLVDIVNFRAAARDCIRRAEHNDAVAERILVAGFVEAERSKSSPKPMNGPGPLRRLSQSSQLAWATLGTSTNAARRTSDRRPRMARPYREPERKLG